MNARVDYHMEKYQFIETGETQRLTQQWGKRKATAACDSSPGIVRLELLLNQMEFYSWKTLPTGELNPVLSIPTTSNFASLNWLPNLEPMLQK